MNNVFVALGNQLFEPQLLIKLGCEHVFMSEDFELCRYEKHHKLKLYLFLTAMREYRDELEDAGLSVQYSQLEDRSENETFLEHLVDFATKNNIQQLNFFEIEDKPFEKTLLEGLTKSNIKSIVHSSPNFLFSREEFHLLNKDNNVFRMANFYQQGRKKFDILIDENQKPIGGKWSFDQENRKKYPQKRLFLRCQILNFLSITKASLVLLISTLATIQVILITLGFLSIGKMQNTNLLTLLKIG